MCSIITDTNHVISVALKSAFLGFICSLFIGNSHQGYLNGNPTQTKTSFICALSIFIYVGLYCAYKAITWQRSTIIIVVLSIGVGIMLDTYDAVVNS